MTKPNNRKEKRIQAKKLKSLRKELGSNFTYDVPIPPPLLFAYGPIVEAFIEMPEAMTLARKALGKHTPEPVLCRMLIDTGATRSFVTPEIATKAELPVIDDDIEVIGVGQTSRGKRHFGRLTLNFSKIHRNNRINQAVWINTEITSGHLPKAQHIDGLIGRDVLSHFRFTYNGKTGIISLQFIK